MENHFLNLNWSWRKNFDRPDDATKPKSLNFDTISPSDPFNLLLNEMNAHLVKAGSTENSIFTSAPETNSEPTDPRKKSQGHCFSCLTNVLKITNFQYNSRLLRHEHYVLFEKFHMDLKDTTFNQHLVNKDTYSKKISLGKGEMLALTEKYETETKYFQEYAENCFPRDITELSENISDFFGQFAVEVWNNQLQQLTIPSNRFQSVTQILDSTGSNLIFKFSKLSPNNPEIGQLWMKEFSQVSRDFLPKLQPNTTIISNFYKIQNSRRLDKVKDDAEDISFHLHTTAILSILSNEKESLLNFKILLDENFQKIIEFGQELPPLSCDLPTAVKLGIRTLLMFELEYWNFNLFSNRNAATDSGKSTEIYKVQKYDEMLLEKFNKFLQLKSIEEIGNTWKIDGFENSKMLVTQKGHFFQKSENEFRPVYISVKVDFHIKFGFQQMTKSELLEEFVHSYFNNCLVYRYRVDLVSLTVVSLKVLEPVDIQIELERSHGVKIQSLFNVLTCITRLPDAKYLMHHRMENDKEPSKIVIFQETEVEADNLFDLNALYKNVTCEILNNLSVLKFIPIAKEISPLQLKFKLAPCSFPVQFKNKPYITPTPDNTPISELNKVQKRKQKNLKK